MKCRRPTQNFPSALSCTLAESNSSPDYSVVGFENIGGQDQDVVHFPNGTVMRPLEPRLIKWAQATRLFLIISVILGTATAIAIVVQAALLARIITDVFQRGADISDIAQLTAGFAAVVAVRAPICAVPSASSKVAEALGVIRRGGSCARARGGGV